MLAGWLLRGGLFGSQRLDWIDHSRSTSRNEGRGESTCYQQECDCCHGPRIVGGDVVEEGSQQETSHVGEGETQSRTCEQHPTGLSQDESHYVAALCAEGDAKAQLFGAMRDEIGKQAIDSSDRDEQGGAAKDDEESSGELLAAVGVLDNLVHCGEGAVGEFGAGFAH